jgi:hypothetical protein
MLPVEEVCTCRADPAWYELDRRTCTWAGSPGRSSAHPSGSLSDARTDSPVNITNLIMIFYTFMTRCMYLAVTVNLVATSSMLSSLSIKYFHSSIEITYVYFKKTLECLELQT